MTEMTILGISALNYIIQSHEHKKQSEIEPLAFVTLHMCDKYKENCNRSSLKFVISYLFSLRSSPSVSLAKHRLILAAAN